MFGTFLDNNTRLPYIWNSRVSKEDDQNLLISAKYIVVKQKQLNFLLPLDFTEWEIVFNHRILQAMI